MMSPATRGKKRKISKTKNESSAKIKKSSISEDNSAVSCSVKTPNEQERMREMLSDNCEQETKAADSKLPVVSDTFEHDGGNTESQDMIKGSPDLGITDSHCDKQLFHQPNVNTLEGSQVNLSSNAISAPLKYQKDSVSPDLSQNTVLNEESENVKLKAFIPSTDPVVEFKREQFLSASQPVTSARKFLGINLSEKYATKFKPPPRKVTGINSNLELEPSSRLLDVEKTSDIETLNNSVSRDSKTGPDCTAQYTNIENDGKVPVEFSTSTQTIATTDVSDGDAEAIAACSTTGFPQTYPNNAIEKVMDGDNNINNIDIDKISHMDNKTHRNDPGTVGKEEESSILRQLQVNTNTAQKKNEESILVADLKNDSQTVLIQQHGHEKQVTVQPDKIVKPEANEQKTLPFKKSSDVHSDNSPLQTQGFIVGAASIENSTSPTCGEKEERDYKTSHSSLEAEGSTASATEPSSARMFQPHTPVLTYPTHIVAQLSFSPFLTCTERATGNNKEGLPDLESPKKFSHSTSPTIIKPVGKDEKSKSCHAKSMDLKNNGDTLFGTENPCRSCQSIFIPNVSSKNSADFKLTPHSHDRRFEANYKTTSTHIDNDIHDSPEKALDTDMNSASAKIAGDINVQAAGKKLGNLNAKENVTKLVREDKMSEVSSFENEINKSTATHDETSQNMLLKISDLKPQSNPLQNHVSPQVTEAGGAQTYVENTPDNYNTIQNKSAKVDFSKNNREIEVNENSTNPLINKNLFEANSSTNFYIQKENSNLKNNFQGPNIDANTVIDRTTDKPGSEAVQVVKLTPASVKGEQCNTMYQIHNNRVGNLEDNTFTESFIEQERNDCKRSGKCAALNDSSQLHALPDDGNAVYKDKAGLSPVLGDTQTIRDEIYLSDMDMQTFLFETEDTDLENTNAELFEHEFQENQATTIKKVNARKAEGAFILQAIMGDLVSINKQIIKMRREMDIVSRNLGRVGKQNERSKVMCSQSLSHKK